MNPLDRLPTATGIHCGIEWRIIPNRFPSLDGYVYLPIGHPWRYYDEMDDIPVYIHGSCLYRSEGWLSFDTCHAGDTWGEETLDTIAGTDWTSLLIHRYAVSENSATWNLAKIIEQTKNLAEQVADAWQIDPIDRTNRDRLD